MNKALGKIPILWVLLPLVAGDVIALLFCKSGISLWVVCGLFITGLALYLLAKYAWPGLYTRRWVPGFGLGLALAALGMANVYLHRSDLREDFFARHLQPQSTMLARITEPLQKKDKIQKAVACIEYAGLPDAMNHTSGKMILYFENDSSARFPAYGDAILIKNQASLLKPPQSPGEFDYSRYMACQDIYYGGYLKKGDWTLTGKNEGNPFWKIVYGISSNIKSEIDKALQDPDERGIAEALILGDESGIPNEVMTDYAGTGTVHILSVSGLHVAIILIGLNWLLSFLVRLPKGQYVRLLFVLLIIWAYAFLTGFSAPMARSVLMFSVVFAARLLGRQSNIYNSICASALVLLLIDPMLIMQASFQLSYIALTGIVWLQPRLACYMQPRGRVARYIWELATASIAAQIVAFPITVLYFNQFSVCFLPANLIIIPASFVVLIAGIAFVFASLVPVLWLHHVFSTILYGCIYGLNAVARFINHLPGASLQGLYISTAGAFLLYVFLVLFICSIIYRNKRLLAGGLAAMLCFMALRSVDEYSSFVKREIMARSVSPGHTVITFKDRNHLYVLSDSMFLADKQLMKYHINGYAWQNYISPAQIVPIDLDHIQTTGFENVEVRPPWIGFGQKKILMVDNGEPSKRFLGQHGKTDADIITVSGDPWIYLPELYKKFHFKTVIASPDNNGRKMRDWETDCIENRIPFIRLDDEICFIQDI